MSNLHKASTNLGVTTSVTTSGFGGGDGEGGDTLDRVSVDDQVLDGVASPRHDVELLESSAAWEVFADHAVIAPEIASVAVGHLRAPPNPDVDAVERGIADLLARFRTTPAPLVDALVPVVRLFIDALRPLTEAPWLVQLLHGIEAKARFAPGQRRPKPRGRRAKERSRLAWKLFVESQRCRASRCGKSGSTSSTTEVAHA